MKRQRMSGKMLVDAIMPMAEFRGWRAVHFRPARTERGWVTAMQGVHSKGWPDLFLLRERPVVVEIKGDGDKLRPEQEEWLGAFERAGIEAYVWGPDEWLGGEVDRVLA